MPQRWLLKLESFIAASNRVSQLQRWKTFLQNTGIKLFTNAVVVTAIFLMISLYATPWLARQIENERLAGVLGLTLSFSFRSVLVGHGSRSTRDSSSARFGR